MTSPQHLLTELEARRGHLRAVAYRMLGSLAEAEDALQEAWLHVRAAEPGAVASPGGFLTTVVARVCLDMLRSRRSRREETPGGDAPEPPAASPSPVDPEAESLLAESVGLALLVVLETLEPAERVAFVLHDLFAMSFDEIGALVGRSPVAARQLASRARRRVQGAPVPEAELARQRRVVGAFLKALRAADVDGLLAVLDPDLVFRSDIGPVAQREARGASSWVKGAVAFSKAAAAIHLVLVDGAVGLALAPRGRLQRVLRFTLAGEVIAEVEVIADPSRLGRLELGVVEPPPPAGRL